MNVNVNLVYVLLVVVLLAFMLWALRRGEAARRGGSPP